MDGRSLHHDACHSAHDQEELFKGGATVIAGLTT
jgi:hypothetical protein